MNMETKVFYVAAVFGTIINPIIAERFSDLADAREYAKLMSRVKKQHYIVLMQESDWPSAEKA